MYIGCSLNIVDYLRDGANMYIGCSLASATVLYYKDAL